MFLEKPCGGRLARAAQNSSRNLCMLFREYFCRMNTSFDFSPQSDKIVELKSSFFLSQFYDTITRKRSLR